MNEADGYRRILHIDLDAFFASVEQRDFPELRGKAIAVGLNSAQGVVASASYEARKFGVRSAMPSRQAVKLCPHLIFVPGRMEVYKSVSAEVTSIFARYCSLIEPVSIDEAFLDVTDRWSEYGYAMNIAKLIRENIRNELSLVASAGVSYNKFLAKVASDWRKPDGLCVIHPSVALKFIDRLPVKAIWGVGPVTSAKMISLGIHTGKDLREQSLEFLIQTFGKAGVSYYNFARGIDDRPVNPNRIRKQVSAETTFLPELRSRTELKKILSDVTDHLMIRLKKSGFLGRSVTLKVRFKDFRTLTRTLSSDQIFDEKSLILPAAEELLDKVDLENKQVRLLGISVGSRLEEESGDLLELVFEEPTQQNPQDPGQNPSAEEQRPF